MQTALGLALRVTHGWSAPGNVQAYTRARACVNMWKKRHSSSPCCLACGRRLLCGRSSRLRANWGSTCTWVSKASDPTLLTQAHWVLGITLLSMGAFAQARAHLEYVMALYKPQHHRAHTLLCGQDPGATSLYYAAWACWYLGYPTQALQRSQQAVTLAQDLSHPSASRLP